MSVGKNAQIEDGWLSRQAAWKSNQNKAQGSPSPARPKAAPSTEGIPVIGLTAHAMATDRDKCLEAGCDDYDTKPVELGRLLEKIERLLVTARLSDDG